MIPMPQDAFDYLNNMSRENKEGVTAVQAANNHVIEYLPVLHPAFKLIEPTVEEQPDAQDDGPQDPGPGLDAEGLADSVPSAEIENDCDTSSSPEEGDGAEPEPDPEPPPIQMDEEGGREEELVQKLDASGPLPATQVLRDRPSHLRPATTRNLLVYNDSYVFNISVAQGMKKHGREAELSIEVELSQMIKKQVWEPVQYRQVPHGSVIIPSLMFLKEKFDASGNFVKIKSRLIAGGHMQEGIDRPTSSPTVSLTAIMMLAAIAAEEQRVVATLDIGGAYLNAPMKNNDTFMILDKKISECLRNLDPRYQAYTTRKGTIIVRLKKALYGCRESGLLWFQTLSRFLSSKGYIANPYNKCVMNKVSGQIQTTCALYVDDIFISGTDERIVDELINDLRAEFKEISVTQGREHSYIGMHFVFDRDRRCVDIDMNGYVSDILETYEVEGTSPSPASRELFMTSESPALDEDEKARFHTVVANLVYLAKRTRPDILTAISFLSTRVQNPTKADSQKLNRVLKYLKYADKRGVSLGKKYDYVVAYVDASYGVHNDCRSHTGVVLTIGNGPILVKSVKQKINSKSSTEAELIALSDAIGDIIWARELFLSK